MPLAWGTSRHATGELCSPIPEWDQYAAAAGARRGVHRSRIRSGIGTDVALWPRRQYAPKAFEKGLAKPEICLIIFDEVMSVRPRKRLADCR